MKKTKGREDRDVPSPFHGFPFLLANLKLTVETFNGHEGVIYRSLHGCPELVSPFFKLHENILQISHTRGQEEVPDKEDPSSNASNIHPPKIWRIQPLPFPDRVGQFLKRRAPLVLTFPGFQERKDSLVAIHTRF